MLCPLPPISDQVLLAQLSNLYVKFLYTNQGRSPSGEYLWVWWLLEARSVRGPGCVFPACACCSLPFGRVCIATDRFPASMPNAHRQQEECLFTVVRHMAYNFTPLQCTCGLHVM